MYEKQYLPNHPRADITGHVPLHILVAEEILHRPLIKGEIVHHKDFDKQNNSPENLLVMSRKEHQQIPALQARFLFHEGLYDKFLGWWKENKDIWRLEKELTKAKRKMAKLKKEEKT